MTELEQQLTNALTALSKQYEAEMEQQAGRVGTLQEQVQRLERSGQGLEAAGLSATKTEPPWARILAECVTGVVLMGHLTQLRRC